MPLTISELSGLTLSLPDAALQRLRDHEGLRLKPYVCPAGRLTIGYGRNLDDGGITEDEAEFLFRNDVQRAEEAAVRLLDDDPLPPQALEVLAHLCFWLGSAGVELGFPKFLAALREWRFADAADELLFRAPPQRQKSKLHKQAPRRANELAAILREA